MLKQIRKEAGMSMRALSEASGIPERTIYHWEAGHAADARYAHLRKVADALGCTMEEIVEGEARPHGEG